VEYTVRDADDATVQTAALAFKNGGDSLDDVIQISSFAGEIPAQLGTGITTGGSHSFTWDVSKDWATDFGVVQIEILAKDKRDLLNLDFIRIPPSADKTLPELKISRTPPNHKDLPSVCYWLVATQNPSIKLLHGTITNATSSDVQYAQGLIAEYYSTLDFTGDKFVRADKIPREDGVLDANSQFLRNGR